MEPAAFNLIDDDELMEEALAILDSVDIDRLGSTSLSDQPAQESPSDQAAADDLLQTAVQAVQAAFPHNNQPPSREHAAPTKQKPATNKHHATQAKPAATRRNGPVVGTNLAPTSRGQGGGRTRMREQLIQLRAVVRKMESHLETLRSPRSSRFSVCSEDGEAARNLPSNENESSRGNEVGGSTDEAAAWRNIAIQQFHSRRHAEQQNAELRESLAAQMQLSKQVEDLLQGQQPHPTGLLEKQESTSKAEGGVKHNGKATKDRDYSF